MSGLLPEGAKRLFDLDAGIRAEADQVLAQSGLGETIRREGFQPVGSYVMRTMTWRDLDFERIEDPPDWDRHWALGASLAKSPWAWKLHCTDAYRDPRGLEDRGLYWGLRVSDPRGGPIWKLDLWTARVTEFERGSPKRAEWTRKLTDEARLRILAIKESVCNSPDYRKNILSVHIYEAVLDHGIREADEFQAWWTARYEGRA